jgi:hypothetical protein
MPSREYYRSQAQLFACLAVASSDPQIAERYNQMALEQLARAEEVEPAAGQDPHGSDDRDVGEAEPPPGCGAR